MIRQIRSLANDGVPASKNLKKLLASLRKTQGFEYLMKTIFGLSGTVNSFDQYGHFVRALIPTNNCFDYRSITQSGCSAKFAAAALSAGEFQKGLEKAFRQALRATTEDVRDEGDADEQRENESDQAADEEAADEEATPDESVEPDTEVGPADELVPPGTSDPSTEGEPEIGFAPSERLLQFLVGDGRRGGSR